MEQSRRGAEGGSLRRFREGRALTLEALAYMGRCDQSTISRIERGLVQPHPETVVNLARALGISVARLLSMLPKLEETTDAP